ncbi:alcohol dehydrogenase [Lentinula lateritia]|uniref:Alcohol dehydrogenase n=1 Tax=Lentinula aff. lateritia TaxID=2804960 RepID=A0ACC1TQ11_9AGAR|nr:alcohol dehydrogenase [Lentinula aff. lateritia]KAJ3846022.1 alcohol dehydrogenase [Lentinula lateritia]
MAQTTLPETHRILQLTSTSEPLQLKTVPTPQAGPGSAVVKVLVAGILSYSADIYNGKRQYPFPKPLVPGSSAIGRIVAVGPDATTLAPGQLVFLDCTIRGRDNSEAVILSGISEGFTEASKKLMHGEWRDSTYAEYTKFPLENCIPLNEQRLLGPVEAGGLGYCVEDLMHVSKLVVPYGGLNDIGLKPGETVIIAPATGPFGSAAVRVALAMGAGRVIAMGRNEPMLHKLSTLDARISTVRITGNEKTETDALKKLGPIDVFFDISPFMAANSTHFKSAIAALRHSGRISLMGGVYADMSFPYLSFMHRNLTMKGTWMFSREQMFSFIQLLESGILPLGEKNGLSVGGKFGLEEWEEAFEKARIAGAGELVVIVP